MSTIAWRSPTGVLCLLNLDHVVYAVRVPPGTTDDLYPDGALQAWIVGQTPKDRPFLELSGTAASRAWATVSGALDAPTGQ